MKGDDNEKSWLKILASIISVVVMVITGASYAFNPTFNIDFGDLFSSAGKEQTLTVMNAPPPAPTNVAANSAPLNTESDATQNQQSASSSGASESESPPILPVDSPAESGGPDSIIAPAELDQQEEFNPQSVGMGGSNSYAQFNTSVVPGSLPAPDPTGAIDIAVITRDPANGNLLTDVCYVLVDYSQQGCDENGDGQVTFASIPYGSYTVRQTVSSAGYQPASDFEINVQPTEYLNGTVVEVPLGFTVKQEPEQHVPNSRHISVVTVNSLTHEKVPTDICVEIVGVSPESCDDDLADGQIDFLDIPAGGPYELKFVLPEGYKVKTHDGPLGIQVDADGSEQPNDLVFILVEIPDETAVTPEETVEIQETAVLDVTLRACPEGIEPQNVDPAVACTIPIDSSDPAGAYWDGEIPGHVLLSQATRLEDGSYRLTVPANVPISLRHLEPNLRDDFLAAGAHGVDEHGAPVITLIRDTTSNVTLYYYFYPEAADLPAVAEQPDIEVPAGTVITMTIRACPEGFDVQNGDYHASCTDPLDAPPAASISWGKADEERAPISSLPRQQDGAYIYEPGSDVVTIEISGLEPNVRDGFKVYVGDEVLEGEPATENLGDDNPGERFTIEIIDGETREIFVFYYFD